MNDDGAAQPARNNLRYRGIMFADHLFAGCLNDRLGNVRERASNDDLTDVKQRTHHEGYCGEPLPKALDNL